MTASESRSWIGDHCANSRIEPINRERACGIIALHAGCEPACLRRISAREYLDNLPDARQRQR